ncbi:MAG: peptidoglycan editing factor PgeF [Xenococcaceae cyanobacterium]
MVVFSSVIPEPQTLTPSWQWQSWEGLAYLTCSLLQDWQHGFFTQQFWPRSPETLVGVLQPDAQAYRVKQVHGNRVLISSEIDAAISAWDSEKTLESADGILSDRAQQAVWVASADCTPVLIGDVRTKMVAAVHAGWRGTAQRIVPEAIARFLTCGSSLENLRVAMGPAITGEVYQVTEQVAAQIGASIIPREQANTPEAILAALQQLPDSPLFDDPKPGRVRLDVRRVNALQLEQLGISDKQVAIAPYCTYQQPEYFFSYRRAKQKKVQWSGIVSNSSHIQ